MKSDRISAWNTHDWQVRSIESITPGGGSRLAFTCRRCGHGFNQTTANHRAWAVDSTGAALADEVTERWLAEPCEHRPGKSDDADRCKFKHPPAA